MSASSVSPWVSHISVAIRNTVLPGPRNKPRTKAFVFPPSPHPLSEIPPVIRRSLNGVGVHVVGKPLTSPPSQPDTRILSVLYQRIWIAPCGAALIPSHVF